MPISLQNLRDILLPGLGSMPAPKMDKLSIVQHWAKSGIPDTSSDGSISYSCAINSASDTIYISSYSTDGQDFLGSTVVATKQEIEDGMEWQRFRDRIQSFIDFGPEQRRPTNINTSFSLSDIEEAQRYIEDLKCNQSS